MSVKSRRTLGTLIMMIVMSFVMIALVTYDNVSVIAAPSNANKISELESDLSGAKKEAAELQKKINDAKAEQLSAQKSIENLDIEIGVLTEQIALIDELETAWKAELEATEKEISELETKKEQEISAFESMLRMSYQYGSDTYFNLIFGSEDIGDFLSRADLINYHLKANENVVTNLTSTLTDLNEKVAYKEESMSKISVYGEEQAENKVRLQKLSAEAEAKKAKFSADEKVLNQQLAAKTAEMNSMEAEIKRLYQESVKNGNTKQYEGGVFAVPTENYRISSEFANRISPITGKRENHNGLDMAAPGGTNIYAAAAGTVIDSRYSNSWGNVIQIDHGGGLVTLYAHCSYRGVQTGQTVEKGQLIARVGTTGWSTGNHLHFTVYYKGVAVNPRNYLPSNI